MLSSLTVTVGLQVKLARLASMYVLKCGALHAAGVIWRGDSLIDGIPETLDLLRSLVSVVQPACHELCTKPYVTFCLAQV